MQLTTRYFAGLDHSLKSLEASVVRANSGSWSIGGEVGAGKRTALLDLRSRLESKNQTVVYLGPPESHLDVAPCALLSLASQLHQLNPKAHKLDDFLNPAPIVDRLSVLEQWMQNIEKPPVFLLEEPASWLYGAEGTDVSFSESTRQVLAFIGKSSNRQVFTGSPPDEFSSPTESIILQRASNSRNFLQNRPCWGKFSDLARQLLASNLTNLDAISPVDLAILVASWSLDKQSTKDVLSRNFDSRELYLTFYRVLCDKEPTVVRYWYSLALCRGPIPSPLLEKLEQICQLTEGSRDFARTFLLCQISGKWYLHTKLSAIATEGMSLSDSIAAHRLLANYYKTACGVAATTQERLENEAEAFFHAVKAGRNCIEEFSCHFVEQLNLLGRHLSRYNHDHEAAVQVFRKALQWDSENAYANHYLAFNLDWLARDPETTSRHYEKAIRLRPNHPWFHQRFINFQLALGRGQEAYRGWLRALDYFGETESLNIYRELHLWIVRMALHRGELGFAQDVISRIPQDILRMDLEFSVLLRQFEGQSIAQEFGALVPAPYLVNGWWKNGPFLLDKRLRSGHELKVWWATRVDEITGDRENMSLRMAAVEMGLDKQPEIFRSEMKMEDLNSWFVRPDEIEVGSFLEIGDYRLGDKQQTRAFVHRSVSNPLAEMPCMRPEPERYLRNVGSNF